jgi:hypothetical protein
MYSAKNDFMNCHVKPCLDIGLAVHWLKPGSKAPKLQEWSTRPVMTLEELKAAWFPGNGLGVRLGHWSRPGDDLGLVVLDIDLRNSELTP